MENSKNILVANLVAQLILVDFVAVHQTLQILLLRN